MCPVKLTSLWKGMFTNELCMCELVAQSCPTLHPWTVAYEASLSMGFSRQECWTGLPFPSPEYLPDPGIEPGSPALQAEALLLKPPGKPQKLIRYSMLIFTNSNIIFYLQESKN